MSDEVLNPTVCYLFAHAEPGVGTAAVIPKVVRPLEAADEVRAAVLAAQQCNHFQNLYAIVGLNLCDLQGHLEQMTQALQGRGSLADGDYVNTNRHMMNALSSIRAYEDIVTRSVNVLLGETHEAARRIKHLISRTMSKPGAYAAMVELRNYAQHSWLPICRVELGFSHAGHVRLLLDRDHWLTDHKSWAKTRGGRRTVEAMPQEIDLFQLVLDANDALRELHDVVMKEFRLANLAKVALLAQLEDEVRAAFPGAVAAYGTVELGDGECTFHTEHVPADLARWIIEGCVQRA